MSDVSDDPQVDYRVRPPTPEAAPQTARWPLALCALLGVVLLVAAVMLIQQVREINALNAEIDALHAAIAKLCEFKREVELSGNRAPSACP